jgi:lipase chaperone LimK
MDVLQLKALFDYYLATQGERTLPEIRQEVERQLAARLSGQPLQDAVDFFHRYLAYLGELGAAGKVRPVSADVVLQMRERLQLLRQLRARHFSPQEVRLLFAQTDAMDELILQRMDIQRRQNISATEKQRLLAELEQNLPPEQRAARQQATQHVVLAEAEQQLRQQGGTPEQLQALRTSMVGAEAAQRLAAVDAEAAAWQGKLQQWQQQREQLGKDGSLSELQRQQALQTLEQQLFSENERKRLIAYQ